MEKQRRIPPSDLLRARAHRILTDRRAHEQAAQKWAAERIGWRTCEELQRMGFSEREISLGAQRW